MSTRDRVSTLGIAAAVSTSVFAIGGATRWAAAIVAALVAICVAAQWKSRRAFTRWPPTLVLFGVAIGWTIVQLMPLPDDVVYTLSPTFSTLRDDGAAIADVAVTSTLTMDVPGTLRALTFLLTLSGVAFVALRLALSERGRYALVAIVAGTAGVAAVVSGIHELFGATALYGLYQPNQASPPIMGPLLNSNHLGCLMAIGAVCSGALFMYPKQTTFRRTMWVVSAAACIVVTLATLSRGAVIALGAGVVVLAAVLVAQRFQAIEGSGRRRRERLMTKTLPIGILVVCTLVLAVYLSAGSAMSQLSNTTLAEMKNPNSKFAAWRSSITLVEESPWAGTGRGAFESAFTRVHPASAFVTFSHLENETLHVAVEWGIPATIALLIVCGWMMLLAIRRWNDGPLAAGALAALMVVAFQSNFDFGIELLGIAVPIVVLLTTLTYVPISEETGARLGRARIVRAAHVCALLAAAAVLFTGSTRTLEEDHRAVESAPSIENAQASIENHPLDYFGYAQLAQALIRVNDPRGVRVLNHAMRLHPTHPGLHRIAARLLVRQGHLKQAETEYAAALHGSRDPRPVLAELTTHLDPTAAAASIPNDLDIDTIVTSLVKMDRTEVALRWLDQVLTRNTDLHAADVLFSLAMEHKRLDLAEHAARVRCDVMTSPQCRLALAKVLAAQKKHDEVLVQLRDVANWRGHRDAQVEGWILLCDAHAAVKNANEAKFCYRRLQGSGLIKPDEVQDKIDALNTTPKPLDVVPKSLPTPPPVVPKLDVVPKPLPPPAKPLPTPPR